MSKPAFRLQGVSRSFGTSTILSDVDVLVNSGERWAVVGPSGSGKTTLLRLIAGLDVPTTGKIEIEGRAVAESGRLLVSPEQRGIAMVFQGLALFPHLNALDQIAFAARGRGGLPEAKQLLERVGLGHRATATLDQLSGGERQRIALARAFAQRPNAILMDEPLASLDDEKRSEMRVLLRALLVERRMTLMLVTHSHEDAFDLSDHVLVLDRGVTAASGALAEVSADPKNAATARSLGLVQVIAGRTADGLTVQSGLGSITLSRAVSPGEVLFLVRRGQIQLTDQGVEVEIKSIQLRPPIADNHMRWLANVNVGASNLVVELPSGSFSPGDRIRIAVTGECVPLARS